MTQPFITIGVTTYNRREMLKECLHSILAQTHVDFEVIVGNDFTSNKLYLDEFGIDDPRFKDLNLTQMMVLWHRVFRLCE